MSKARCARRRDRLYKENPYCPFCGVLMVLPKDVPGYPHIKIFPDNICTLEHIYPKNHPRRRDRDRNTTLEQNFICCGKCNHSRGEATHIQFGKNISRPNRSHGKYIGPKNKLSKNNRYNANRISSTTDKGDSSIKGITGGNI